MRTIKEEKIEELEKEGNVKSRNYGMAIYLFPMSYFVKSLSNLLMIIYVCSATMVNDFDNTQ